MKNRACVLSVVAVMGIAGGLPADDEKDSTPAAYAPFEHLIGGWKGQGIPAKNRLKGWPEKHNWSWKFDKGRPVGMTLELTGSKVLKAARLSYDEKADRYILDGTDPSDKPIRFAGRFKDRGGLSLDRDDPPAGVGKERLDLALNDNQIRYGLRLFRQEPGAPQFALVTDANMGKEGESFAAGGAAADLPRCIVTGGAGGMTVSFEGKSYPICCSGCRDEFNDNPRKYVQKYLLRPEKGEAAPLKTTAAAPPDAEGSKSDTPKSSSKGAPAKAKAATKTATDKADPATRAASLLTQAQALEKSGKAAAALGYYKKIAGDYPDTASAKTAKARIKALGEK